MPQGTIIVTGASRGIGEAIVRNLADRGYSVAGLSRTGTCAAGTGYACDVTSEVEIVAVIKAIAAKGSIVGLVNNAGQYAFERSDQMCTADFEKLMRINMTSAFITAREVYPYMKAAGGGLIANISSFFARMGVSQHLAYCASKAAIEAMTRCLAVEWAQDDIRVLAVAPGYIRTSFNYDFIESERGKQLLATRVPVRRVGQPEEVGELVGSLFRSDIGFLTGETIQIDGGQGINL